MVDLLPQALQRWQAVESVARTHFQRSGFGEIRTPVMEPTDLFCRGIGEATDVVGKEMYTFNDRGDRSCTLRPEGTASVVRAALQHGLLSQGPQKLWYAGPMFRYERPQAGRQRQFHQIGVELLGAASARADVEVIALAWDLLASLGVGGLELELNSLGSTADRCAYRTALVGWLEQRSNLLDEDSRARLNTNPLRILDSKSKATQALLDGAPTLANSLAPESRERFEVVQQGLASLGIPFRLNPRLVRGLDYYCHTAFEFVTNALGAQGTVLGGGRYDGLSEMLGGPRFSGVGWAAGVERLAMLVGETVPASPKVAIVTADDAAQQAAFGLTETLRDAGIDIDLPIGGSMGKKLKKADKAGIRLVVIMGSDELAKNIVLLRDLSDGSQHELPFDAVDKSHLAVAIAKSLLAP